MDSWDWSHSCFSIVFEYLIFPVTNKCEQFCDTTKYQPRYEYIVLYILYKLPLREVGCY